MKRILLPTDFSDNTWNSIVYALKLFKHEFCEFYLLHASEIHISTINSLAQAVIDDIQEKPLQELNDLKEQLELADPNANHSFKTIFKIDNLIGAIGECVTENNIDLVIMATKGASGLKEVLIGSNAVNAINYIKSVPVLIIPIDFEFVIPKEIAFASDFKHAYTKEQLQPITQLADLFDSAVRIIHIDKEESLSEEQEQNIRFLESYFKDYQYSIHWVPDFAKKRVAITTCVAELECQILCMINNKHSIIEELIKEPVIQKLGSKPQLPFLVIPE